MRSIRTQLVAPALAIVRESGADADALRARFSLAPVADAAEVEMPLEALDAFLEAAALAANEPSLGLRIAARFRRGMYGLMEFTSRTAPTLRDACARIAKYLPLVNEVVTVSFTEGPDGGTITQRVEGAPRCLGRHANEFFVGAIVLQSRAVTGVPIVPRRASFAHVSTAERAELEETLGTRALDFATESNAVVLSAAALDAPLVTHDPALLSILDRHAEESLAKRAPHAGSRFLGRVRATIREHLAKDASLEAIARATKTTPRTLQRRLGEEGSSFQQLLDAVREELARTWVAEGKRSLTEIAFDLGYAEQSAFLRAFKRWTSTTPGRFRAGG